MARFSNFTQDYNLLDPEDMDELLFSAFDQALGEETRERLRQQFENYEYYDGKQHTDENGNLVDARELERPAGLDYDPTRYATNYFKAVIDRKARWQMGGEHSVHVPRPQIDDEVETVREGYEPSAEQQSAMEIADGHEAILKQLWRENKMRTKLLRAARDRLIADRVVCKLVFNPSTGKLRWIWRPDTEYIPIYSDDDFEDLIACHFVRQMIYTIDGEDVEAIRIQTFRLNEERTDCLLSEEVIEAETLDTIETIMPEGSMGLDFIPVVEFQVDELLGGELGDGEISHLREQNDILNMMNEDAIDSLKFEMFSMTALINAAEGTAQQMQIAPGTVIEMRNAMEGQAPDVKKVEGGFRWKDAFKDQYSRVKAAMHEVSGLPQIVPQELNFGGLNGEALRVLFHDIISDTEEHWHSWGYGLSELHEKSIRYLQARTREADYDTDILRRIEDYHSEVKFVLPLPDNRQDLVDLLGNEMMNELESKRGAMERLGVDNVQAKMQEIETEKMKEQQRMDPYAGAEAEGEEGTEEEVSFSGGQMMGGSRGDEPLITCPDCGGSGSMVSRATGDMIQCTTCGGKGYVQERQR
jgi:hypothetical protein